MREGRILPHLAAVAILLAGEGPAKSNGTVQLATAADIAGLIDQLRTAGITLTYDPDTRTLRAGGGSAVVVAMGRDR